MPQETNIGAPAPGITELAEGLLHRLLYEWTPAVSDAVMSVSVVDWPDEVIQGIAQNAQDAIDGGAESIEVTHLARTQEQIARVNRLLDVKPVMDLDYAASELRKDAQRRRFEVNRVNTALALKSASTESARALLERLIDTPTPTDNQQGLQELISDTITGKRQNIVTPWKQVDSFCHALLPQSICLLCGGPGSGKTFFLIQLINWLKNQKVPFSYYALEEDRTFVLLRLLAQNSRCAEILNPVWVKENPEETERFLKAFEPRIREFNKVLFAAPEKKVDLVELPQWIKHRSAKGDRVIIVDPASVADFGKDIAKNVNEFMERTKDTLRKNKNSAIIALHPNSESMAKGIINMGMLKGGANFSILTQTIWWLEMMPHGHEEHVEGPYGGIHPIQFNRRLWLLKTRNGKGQGIRLAFNFNPDTLLFDELGIVRKPEKANRFARNIKTTDENGKDELYDSDEPF